MNKFALFFSICLLFSSFTFAQTISDHAIGIRTGDNDGFGVEISYQYAFTQSTRLEADLGLRSGNDYDGFKLTGLFQWVMPLDNSFHWYVGAGGGVGSYSFDNVPAGVDDGETFLFVAGNAGIEYNFKIPLLLSLDVRPELGFGDFRDDFDFDLGLGIRYQF